MNFDHLYIELKAKYLAMADKVYPNLSDAQKDQWAHVNADMFVRGNHLLQGKPYSRGPTVLK